jgi:hypothetical protein
MSTDSFRTKRGRARLTDDEIRFEESFAGYVRSLYRSYWCADAWWRKAVFAGYVLGLAVAVGWVIHAVASGRLRLLAAVCGLLIAIWVVDYLRGFRSSDRVALSDVESVSATRGEKGVTRPRLVVRYAGDGAVRKRRVNLPSLYTPDGEAAFERAQTAFAERGFDVE